MFLRLEGNTVVVASRTLWAGVHNDGGSAGHGAKIPERKFLELKPEYREKFREFMAEHFAEAWNGK
jgi:phage gpG-like protein